MYGSHKIKASLPGLLFSLLIIAVSCERESSGPAGAESFIKFFSYHGIEEGIGVKAIDDMGYVMVGNTVTEESGVDIVLIRTDEYGNEMGNVKYFGGDGDDRANTFIVLSDGGFAILGSTTSGPGNMKRMYLVRTDNQGNKIWARDYNSNTDEIGYSLAETRDGGFVMLGTAADPVTGNTNIRIVKTDPEGSTRWSRTHGGVDDDKGLDIIETNYGFIYTGSTRSYPNPGQSGSNIFIVKTNPSGIVTYPYTYGRSGDDYGRRILSLPGGGYIVMGTATDPATGIRNVYLGQIGEDIAQALWTNTYGGDVNHTATCIKVTPEGDYIITGTQELTDENHVIFLLKTDPDGNEIFFRTFGGSGRQRAESVDIAKDGGYIITGSNNSEDFSTITLIKTQPDGRL